MATLVRVFGEISVAEDAFLAAREPWPHDGVSPHPAGWIVTTAGVPSTAGGWAARDASSSRHLCRHPSSRRISVPQDDQLRLIFTCCHPALRAEQQVALTLRLLGGLSVEEIARSFLVTEDAMAKRLFRPKHKIKSGQHPYRVPSASDPPFRPHAVLSVVYLINNTGAEDPNRAGPRLQAIGLARAQIALLPNESESTSLLAQLLSPNRAPARWVAGEPVLLAEEPNPLGPRPRRRRPRRRPRLHTPRPPGPVPTPSRDPGHSLRRRLRPKLRPAQVLPLYTNSAPSPPPRHHPRSSHRSHRSRRPGSSPRGTRAPFRRNFPVPPLARCPRRHAPPPERPHAADAYRRTCPIDHERQFLQRRFRTVFNGQPVRAWRSSVSDDRQRAWLPCPGLSQLPARRTTDGGRRPCERRMNCRWW